MFPDFEKFNKKAIIASYLGITHSTNFIFKTINITWKQTHKPSYKIESVYIKLILVNIINLFYKHRQHFRIMREKACNNV